MAVLDAALHEMERHVTLRVAQRLVVMAMEKKGAVKSGLLSVARQMEKACDE